MSDSSVPDLRLSDAERDEVVSQLSLAMSEGRIDVGEFEERSRTVYAATVRSDLDGVLEGLPVVEVTDRAVGAEIATATSDRRWFVSVLGDRHHRGSLDMGRKSTAVQVLGDVTFDLSEVHGREVDLQIVSVLGDVTIVVAQGTTLDLSVVSLLGDRKDNLPLAAGADAMRVRCRVFSLLGDVTVRTPDP